MSEAEFVIGLPARADAAAVEHSRTRPDPAAGFTPADLIARIEQAFGARSPAPGAGAEAGAATSTAAPPAEPHQPGADGPRHFSPANPDSNPTAGWDMMNPGEPPRHFSPVDPDSNPTAGWDMLNPQVTTPLGLEQLQAARAEGYQDGLVAGTIAAEADRARDTALLDGIASAMKAGGAIDRAAMAEALRRTVTMLVTQMVGEIGVSAPLLAARVEAATDLLADASESAMLRVHPDDVPLLEGRLPATVFPVGDEQIARGSFVMEAASTIVEDGPAMWLDQLSVAIERAAVPAC